jgi:hypothetical protein
MREIGRQGESGRLTVSGAVRSVRRSGRCGVDQLNDRGGRSGASLSDFVATANHSIGWSIVCQRHRDRWRLGARRRPGRFARALRHGNKEGVQGPARSRQLGTRFPSVIIAVSNTRFALNQNFEECGRNFA